MGLLCSDVLTDTLTLLGTLDGSPVVKRIYIAQGGRLQTEPAPLRTWYRGAELGVQSAGQLFALLDQVQQDPTLYLVRGRIRAGIDTERMRRTHADAGSSLVSAPHRWVLLDLDKYRSDVTDFASDPAKYATEARQALPEPFRGAACWWQATGSAGIKPGVRLRLAFWLDRPLGDADWKAWVKDWEVPVDSSLFTPSQPHFTGWPVFDPGITDPVQLRSGVLPGSDVAVPPRTDQTKALRAQEDLASAARKLRKTEEGERRNQLNRLAFALAAKWPEDELTGESIARSLLDAGFAAGLGGSEALLTVQAAIKDGRAKLSTEREGWRGQLARDKEGALKSTAANVSLYFEHHPAFKGRLAYDERAFRPIWVEPPPWGGDTPRALTESDETYAIEWFQEHCWVDAKPMWVRAGFLKSAQLCSFDPVQDYLNRLPQWDGTPRVDTLFIRHLGVEDNALHRAWAGCWMLQAYRRAFATVAEPVQADYILVLTGLQGQRKSSMCRALCPLPRFFRANLPDISTKDALSAISDAWIVELSEMTHRKADRDAFKSFITACTDKFRPPYARNEVECPRRAVMIGTTNDSEFLTDPSGNRRFWPMEVTRRADIDEVKAERDQLWAETKARAEAGEAAYPSEEIEAKAAQAQESFREEDAVETALRTALDRPMTGGTFDAVRFDAGQLDAGKRVVLLRAAQAADLIGLNILDNRQLGRIKSALKAMQWKERRIDGSRYWCPPWRPPAEAEARAN